MSDNLINMLNDLHRFSVGYDTMLHRINNVSTSSNYPPYNVVKLSETVTQIEIAVAGFSQDDLNVTEQNGMLTVSGEDTSEPVGTYLHRGIAARKFSRSWQLAENVDVKGAEVKNGILVVTLEHQIPEEAKPKKIPIQFKK